VALAKIRCNLGCFCHSAHFNAATVARLIRSITSGMADMTRDAVHNVNIRPNRLESTEVDTHPWLSPKPPHFIRRESLI
jgi:hypothetical protein